MNQEEDYASDSEQSDEDFCPDKEAGVSDAVSEESTDDAEDSDEEEPTEVNRQSKSNKHKSVVRKTKKSKKNVKDSADTAPADEPKVQQSSRRSTRQTDETAANGKSIEKVELESDEEDKSRTDALWADFLSDVKPVTTSSSSSSRINKGNSTAVTAKSTNGTSRTKEEADKSTASKSDENKMPKKITVTEIVDFAGEEVRVEKVVNADSIKVGKEGKPSAGGVASSSSRLLPTGIKRNATGGGGGLGTILNQLGKKKKISVLEKTQLDWKNFKQDEGIEEELLTHNKGKDGFLERQDFLQRTDVRQFEIEKTLRQTKRSN